jgi:hypothetical protein
MTSFLAYQRRSGEALPSETKTFPGSVHSGCQCPSHEGEARSVVGHQPPLACPGMFDR